MAHGLEVYDSGGTLFLGVTTRLTRYITTLSIASLAPGASITIGVSGITADGTWVVAARNFTSFQMKVTIMAGQVQIQNTDPYVSHNDLSFAVFRF